MKQYILKLVFIFCTLNCLADSSINDPSLLPLRNFKGDVVERYRILGDLHADEIEDMLLSSENISIFGNAGGFFDIFLKHKNGKYEKYDSVFINPASLAIEKIGNTIRLWTYHRQDGQTGSLRHCELKLNELSNCQWITIYPGDGGTEMGKLIYNAVFDNSYVKFKIEESWTDKGIVKWKKLE